MPAPSLKLLERWQLPSISTNQTVHAPAKRRRGGASPTLPNRVQDYHPGTQYADVESALPRRRTFNDRPREEPAPPRGPVDDGSGPRGAGPAAGLGWSDEKSAVAGDKLDVFQKYRQMRSGVYFEQIHRSLAKRGGEG